LGRIENGTTGITPFDLSLAGISHAKMIVIQDFRELDEREKNEYQDENVPLDAFNIDSVELVHTVRETHDKKEM
jgi:hypothetical protein